MILAILKKESSESNRRFIGLGVFCDLLPANHGPFRGLTKDPGSKPDSRPTEKCGKKARIRTKVKSRRKARSRDLTEKIRRIMPMTKIRHHT